MDGSKSVPNIFVEFDRSPVPEAWLPDLSDTLLQLGAGIEPIDRPILAPLTACLARHSKDLREQAGRYAPVDPPTVIHGSHPASATLFRYRHGHSEGLERLAAIGLCALLEASSSSRGPAERLLTMVRGALDGNLVPKCSKALSFDSIRRQSQLSRLSAAVPNAGTGSPSHHAGHHRRCQRR